MNSRNIVLLVLAFVGTSNIVRGEKIIQLFPDYNLKFSHNERSDMIDFFVDIKSTGWFGLGYNEEAEMLGADMAIGTIDENGKPQIVDYHGVDHNIVKDKQQDLHMIEKDSFVNATHMHVHFQRKLVTGDPNKGEDKDIKDAENYIIWAFGSSKSPSYHSSNRGVRRINILASEHKHSTSGTTSKPSAPTSSLPPSTTPADSATGTVQQFNWNNFITLSVLFTLTLFRSN